MKKFFSGIINLKEGQSELDFQVAFNKFMDKNEWSYTQENVIELPHDNVKVSNASILGTAVFDENYEAQEDGASEVNKRYFLCKTWETNLPVMCAFMMNPSKANEIIGDTTVDFMIKYAKFNGYGTLVVVNTSPIIKGSGTTQADFVVDEENYFYIDYAVNLAEVVVLAWGENGQKFGIPLLNSNTPLRNLFNMNIEKLRVFKYGKENSNKIFPMHPHPQNPNQRFNLDSVLRQVSQLELDTFCPSL